MTTRSGGVKSVLSPSKNPGGINKKRWFLRCGFEFSLALFIINCLLEWNASFISVSPVFKEKVTTNVPWYFLNEGYVNF